MNVTYRQSQLRDYLTQILELSGKKRLPKITQGLVATQLSMSGAGVSVFLHKEQNSPKILKNFIKKYPIEFDRWPKKKKTIERVLLVSDAMYFLGIPVKVAVPKPLNLKIENKREIIPSASKKTEEVKNAQDQTKSAGKKPLAAQAVKVEAAIQSKKLEKTKLDEQIPTEKQPKTDPKPIKKSIKAKIVKAPIAISYRGHQSIKDGQGMLFDHMRLQDLAKFPTRTLVPETENILHDATKFFKSALKNHCAALLFGKEDKNSTIYPSNVQDCADLGLLVIPGRARAIEDEPIRLAHEYKVIREALNRGQPIIGICAGSWRLYEQLYTWTKFPKKLRESAVDLSKWHKKIGTLTDVTDHSYSRMICLDVNGVKASYNVQIHNIFINKASLLEASMKTPYSLKNADRTQTVNSVHWKAVNKDKLPKNIVISAKAIKCSDIHKKTRQGDKMKPQKDIAEAFENVHGAPLLGIQWHPEGYDVNTPHANLIKYMVLAGNAYAAKRKMLIELKSTKLVLKKFSKNKIQVK